MSFLSASAVPIRMWHNGRVRTALRTAGLLIATLIVITSGILFSSYRDTVERERSNLHNLSAAFAAQTGYATRAFELIFNGIERDYANGLPARGSLVSPAWLGDSARHEHLLGVYLYDNDGRLLAQGLTSRGVAASRTPAPPPAPPAGAGRALAVGVDDVEPASGKAVITVSRALFDAAGRRSGLVVARADATVFQRIFDETELGEGGSVTLFNRDGTMLVRGPPLPNVIGRSFSATPLFQRHLPSASHGTFERVSPIDGKLRLYGYSTVEGYPLVIITGMDKARALQVWTRWLWAACAFLALMALTLLFLAWRVGRESSQQAALIGRLASSEARLAQSSEYLKNILDALATPVWVRDAGGRLLLFNQRFCALTGRPAEELRGKEESAVLDDAGAHAREQLYRQVLEGDGPRQIEIDVRDAEGRSRTMIQLASRLSSADGSVQIVSAFTDITDRKQVEMRLAYLADFDLLTELPNHNQFRRVLEEAIPEAGARGERLAVLLVALERLHEVADLLGHEAADETIRQVSAILRKFLPATRCIARVKNNEFAVMLRMTGATQVLEQFADELRAALSGPFCVHDREFYLDPLVGISLYPQDATSVHELLRLADVAKHRAGSESGEPVHFFSERSHSLLNERLALEEQLRRALGRGQLRVAYQPKVDLRSGLVVGFEALLRWSSPSLGEVTPSRFVPIAESTGLILPIGAWVLETACHDATAWRRELGAPVKVAVNLSIRQFYQKDLVQTIARALAASGIEPSSLELEITESTAMSRGQGADALLEQIRALGVELSIDDFGTGYSSLAYLKRFPVQRLKVDRAFVRDLGRDADSAAIVRSIVTLGHGLQMRIVAEGVETHEQLGLLRELGCDEYQGFLFSRAVPASEVPALLRDNRSGLRIASRAGPPT